HFFFFFGSRSPLALPSFPTRRSSDLRTTSCAAAGCSSAPLVARTRLPEGRRWRRGLRLTAFSELRERPDTRFDVGRHRAARSFRSEEHTSELQSQSNLVCRLLLEKKN